MGGVERRIFDVLLIVFCFGVDSVELQCNEFFGVVYVEYFFGEVWCCLGLGFEDVVFFCFDVGVVVCFDLNEFVVVVQNDEVLFEQQD